LVALEAIPVWAIALIITIIVSFVTEITSNAAVISLMLPILNALAVDLEINPLYLTLSAGMAASYAFMLPIATPPNAIVFSYGHLKILNMASVGFMINILCILVVTLGINTWGMALFDLDTIPWATTNSTVATTHYSVT
jgi:di/tricarboxylate transporter